MTITEQIQVQMCEFLLLICDFLGGSANPAVIIWVKIFKTEKNIAIHLVRLPGVCGKVLSEKYAYKSVKTALLLSNVINVDHQNSCLFTNNIGHFSLPLWVLICVLASNTLPIALTRLSEHISTINSV